MATILKPPSGTWKAVIRKQGRPTVAKTFRTKRDSEDWARGTEDEMVRGGYIKRATADRMMLEDAVDKHSNSVLGWIVRIVVATGMRASEIMTLTVPQIDLNRRIVSLHHTKDTEERTAPLSKQAVFLFQQALANPAQPQV